MTMSSYSHAKEKKSEICLTRCLLCIGLKLMIKIIYKIPRFRLCFHGSFVLSQKAYLMGVVFPFTMCSFGIDYLSDSYYSMPIAKET